MRCRTRLVAFWVLALVMALFAGMGNAGAQSAKRALWDRLDVEIAIQPNGDFTVREISQVRFEGGTFTYGYRQIPSRRFVYLTDVAVAVDGTPLRRTGAPGGPGTFYRDDEDDTVNIRYFFPSPLEGKHTVVLRYRVQGGLRYYPGGDQLWWKAVYPDRKEAVAASRVTVTLPTAVNPQSLVAAAYGHPATWSVVDGGRRVVFEATDIPPGQELEVRVQFPEGLVRGGPAAWQRQEDFWAQWGPVLGALFLALIGVGFVLPVVLWYQWGRDAPVTLAAEYLSEPPDDLPPALVDVLVDEKVSGREILATLIDLARRGGVVIEQRRHARRLFKWNVAAPTEIVFHLIDPSKCRHPVEEETVRTLFQDRPTVSTVEFWRDRAWHRRIRELVKRYYDLAVEADLFTDNPAKVRRRWRALGFVISALGFLAGFIPIVASQGEVTQSAPFFMLVPFAGILVGFVWMAFAPHMPRKTKWGSEAAARWRAFKRYLENVRTYGDLDEVRARWEDYLPYAVALGVDKHFLRALPETSVSSPRWYHPAGASGPSLAPRTGSTLSAGFTDSLQAGSTRTAVGVQALSVSLASAIQTAATTFNAAGGRSGGFSGGGSSGGGGGGGGGGGFG